WYNNQIIITYYSTVGINCDNSAFLDAVDGYELHIHQDILNSTPYTLHRVSGQKNVALAGNNGSNDLAGISVFPAPTPPTESRVPPAILAVPYTISIDSGKMPNAQNMPSMPGNEGTGNMRGDEKDHTLIVIDHLHKHNTVNKT